MLTIHSLPMWKAHHCYEDLNLHLLVSWGRKGKPGTGKTCIVVWVVTLVRRLSFSRIGTEGVAVGLLFLYTCV